MSTVRAHADIGGKIVDFVAALRLPILSARYLFILSINVVLAAMLPLKASPRTVLLFMWELNSFRNSAKD